MVNISMCLFERNKCQSRNTFYLTESVTEGFSRFEGVVNHVPLIIKTFCVYFLVNLNIFILEQLLGKMHLHLVTDKRLSRGMFRPVFF